MKYRYVHEVMVLRMYFRKKNLSMRKCKTTQRGRPAETTDGTTRRDETPKRTWIKPTDTYDRHNLPTKTTNTCDPQKRSSTTIGRTIPIARASSFHLQPSSSITSFELQASSWSNFTSFKPQASGFTSVELHKLQASSLNLHKLRTCTSFELHKLRTWQASSPSSFEVLNVQASSPKVRKLQAPQASRFSRFKPQVSNIHKL